MKVKEIKDLIDFLSNSGLEEVKIETEEFKVNIKRSNETQVIERAVAAAPAPVAAPVAAAPAPAAPAPAAAAPAAPAEDSAPAGNYVEIKSPMIGTFYRAANPESPNFANVGDKVSAGSTVCIVEAMKLFNEIESEVSGTIVKVLVDDSQPVEYDQPLFLVDPS
ncbi:acetyl-CoA carboxylase biotin carboxyl carrier protein [Reichenbachiella sp.]|uniref:acetyl-CoA carboxylase biotin carboxyl carrier protein n=1 Tax=Reichenbachiella sp. TaxID=2184521 RepID=UPI003BB18ABE